jgi:hypothetical protein
MGLSCSTRKGQFMCLGNNWATRASYQVAVRRRSGTPAQARSSPGFERELFSPGKENDSMLASETIQAYRSKATRFLATICALCAVTWLLTPAALAAPKRTPPSTPGNFHVTGSMQSPASVTFAWTASKAGSDPSFVYVIVNKTTGLSLNVGNVTSYTWAEVEAGGTYSFYIYAADTDNDVSADSPVVTVTVPGTPIPTAVQPAAPVITQVSATSDSIAVSWTEATPVNEIGSYQVLVNGMAVASPPANSTTANATNLWPGTNFTVTVVAYSLNGTTGALTATSAPATVTTAASTSVSNPAAPTAPTNLTGGGDGGGEAIISWNPSTSPNEAQSQIQYNIYIDGVLDTFDSSVGVTQQVYIFPRGATVPAQVFVVAVDQFGNQSLPSNVLTISGF